MNACRRIALAYCACALFSGPSIAQGNPGQPLRTVMPYSAGSGPDAAMRRVGELLGRELERPVMIDNKPGGNGWLATGEVKRAKPDGNTLLMLDGTYMALQPHLYKNLPFDPAGDFEPVAGVYTTGFFIVVGAASPWKSVAELVAAAKAKPGDVSYGSWGQGSVAHVGTAQFEAASGTRMLHVPFKELPQLYTAVSTSEVDWAFGSAATVGPLYRAGKVRLLAYGGAKRLAGYESISTIAEAGGPTGIEVRTWVAIYAPKKTPAATIDRIHTSLAKVLTQPAVRESLDGFGFEPWAVGPAELARTQNSDTQRYAGVVQRARIALD